MIDNVSHVPEPTVTTSGVPSGKPGPFINNNSGNVPVYDASNRAFTVTVVDALVTGIRKSWNPAP